MSQHTPHLAGCACCADYLIPRFGRRLFIAAAGAAGLVAGLPRPAAAQGGYDAMVLTCIDPRFPAPTMAWAQQQNLVGRYSQFAFAGSAIGVVAPAFQAWHRTFWDNLGASIQLHGIPKVIAINHRDCGAAKIAYGAARVADRQVETVTHLASLETFRAQVRQRHPTMLVDTGLMDLDGSIEMFG
ncbi:hypothetical protein ACQW02_03270 [Humitalea sp. 24SJ18S-53]|uniref:hypothetical protein n=1 Tax=Humitalea sp. 24SJ18S-53 TaxID=3422307 RepID=UPI003D66A85C